MSNSVQPHGLHPTRLLRPWDLPGRSTGVGCHCLLHCITINSLISLTTLNLLVNNFFLIVQDLQILSVWFCSVLFLLTLTNMGLYSVILLFISENNKRPELNFQREFFFFFRENLCFFYQVFGTLSSLRQIYKFGILHLFLLAPQVV